MEIKTHTQQCHFPFVSYKLNKLAYCVSNMEVAKRAKPFRPLSPRVRSKLCVCACTLLTAQPTDKRKIANKRQYRRATKKRGNNEKNEMRNRMVLKKTKSVSEHNREKKCALASFRIDDTANQQTTKMG